MKYYGIDFIDDFLYEKAMNQWVTEATIHSYNSIFNTLFLNPFVDVEKFETYTEMNFKRFLWNFSLKNKWSAHTYNRYRKCLKCFCDYLVRNNYIKVNPLNNIPVKSIWKTLPRSLNQKQVRELIKKIETTFPWNDFMSLRNKTIVYFYIYTWARLKEIVNLKFSDIDFIAWQIRINKAKWNKDRIIPLVNTLSDFLIDYLLKKKRSRVITDIIFPTRFWWVLQHRDIYEIFKKVKSWLSFSFTPHMLRHTFATELVRKKIDIYSIAKVLWHSSIKTTQIYFWLETTEIRDSINSVKLFT